MASLYIEFEESDFDDIDICDPGFRESGHGGGAEALGRSAYAPFDDGLPEGDPFNRGGPAADGSATPEDVAVLDPFDPGSQELIGRLGMTTSEEVLGVAPRRDVPRWSWARMPERRRRILVGTMVLAGLGVGIGDALSAEAAQRAADRPTLDLLDASFTGNADGDGFDLLLGLSNGGASTTTITAVDVHQPGLSLLYPGAGTAVGSHQQIEIVLTGTYDCSGLTGDPATVRVTVHTSHGTAADLDFQLPSDAKLPDGWLASRAAFCY